ncbi:MAG: hypothetical protein EA442_05190 [Candidatus Nitrosopelagicus sp.]|nr:MAG: hypothetical protein EA442_05190 [Candidatus Nitrosopelagicus sp.]
MAKSVIIIGIVVAIIIGIVAVSIGSVSNEPDTQIEETVPVQEPTEGENFYIDENGIKHYTVEAVDAISPQG